ncbi:MAG TPA: GSU2403 family nucleotidyltransferase fold protein [Ramlibacter sp.]|uniref:GSU2403 family nucleotidyltransferase fold protein n=1 Tax=Ramlibacter sp. TaxID=1917967 RepID=UPI002BDC591F|nr:GSU2403 family nucleotidyltransferase fold protein [Ramlibacter sp.]HVZ45890.1 GSU2403 family nucleotidyltransferase fold protein [Ramlibacter sp.]
MDYLPLSDGAARQLIDSSTLFSEWNRLKLQASRYEGGMYWKRQGDYEYLVRTLAGGRQRRIGPRSAATQRVYDAFKAGQSQAQSRLSQLQSALLEAERLNRALKVGRVPSSVVDLLRTLEDVGLGNHFAVVGTNALYAYETAAGVRIVQGALATQDIDLLWDARKRIQFVTDLGKLQTSMLGVLRRADPSFRRKEGQNETAVNARGFEVDFLRRQPEGADPHPFRFSDDEDDLWPVQAVRASVLTTARRFEHVVAASSGRMALMRTVSPKTFVEFKRWMASQTRSRLALKRRRDARQADIVEALLKEGLLMDRPGD